MLSGVLERAPQPRPEPAPEPEPTAPAEPKGRGAQPAARPVRAPAARAAKRIKGRTVYLPDDLFERILVQAHRKDLTISDYVTMLLDRHVPDHRRIGPASAAADQGETDAA
jgi:hypothetical protein